MPMLCSATLSSVWMELMWSCDLDTRRENWNFKSFTGISHVIVNRQGTSEVTHPRLAWTGAHANGDYLIMLHLRSNIQQEHLNHLPCSVGGWGALCMDSALKYVIELGLWFWRSGQILQTLNYYELLWMDEFCEPCFWEESWPDP